MNDRYYDSNSEKISEDEYQEERATYQPLKPTGPVPRRPWIIPAMIVGIVILVMFFLWTRQDPGDAAADQRIAELTTRVEALEQRLAALADAEQRIQELENSGQAFQQAVDRFSRFEATMTAQVERLQKNPGAQATTAKPKESPPAAKEPAKEVYHTVKQGETLYSISRNYDVPVDLLRKANNIGKDNTIRPGQKLVIKKGS
jgi:LysM repeat protein